jgi:hypothetical protein
MAVQIARRRRFTVDEYYRMAKTGIIHPAERGGVGDPPWAVANRVP